MLKKALKFIIAILYLLLIVMAVIAARKMTFDELISYAPSNIFLAIIFMLFLFALKSISIFFPIILLQIACGFLFPAPIALLVNIVGSLIDFTLPYLIGRFTGGKAALKQINKNPKLVVLFEKQHSHEFFLSFFLRVISCLPCNIVSMYMGAMKFYYPKYIISSLLGSLPGLIPATFMGMNITKPSSPEFLTALSITVICSLVSLIVFYIYDKRSN